MTLSKLNIQAIFFDLDGTLLDTASDLNNACNDILQKYHYSSVPLTKFRHDISGGTDLIISNNFKIQKDDARFFQIKQEFLVSYEQQLHRQTQIFPAVDTLLNFLDDNHIAWGIVTGKPTYLAKPLLQHFKLLERSQCLVAGDTIRPGKPHPAPLLYACELLGYQASHCVYIGDANVDIEAAKSAGMSSIAVAYGYHGIDHDPHDWNADFVAETSELLFNYICQLLSKSSQETNIPSSML